MKTTIHGTLHQFNEHGGITGSVEITVVGDQEKDTPEEVTSGYLLAAEKLSEGEKDD